MYLSDQCLGIATCSLSCHPIFLLEEMEKKICTLLDRAVTDMSVVILQKLGLRNVNDLSIHCVYREICTLQSFCLLKIISSGTAFYFCFLWAEVLLSYFVFTVDLKTHQENWLWCHEDGLLIGQFCHFSSPMLHRSTGLVGG